LPTNLSPIYKCIELNFHKITPLDLRSGILYSKEIVFCNIYIIIEKVELKNRIFNPTGMKKTR